MLPPTKLLSRCGSTGMIIPNARMSSRAVMKMKASAARRTGGAETLASTESPAEGMREVYQRGPTGLSTEEKAPVDAGAGRRRRQASAVRGGAAHSDASAAVVVPAAALRFLQSMKGECASQFLSG